MRFSLIGFAILAFLSTARADVADELAHMLAKYPEADADGDGTLTEAEAGNYILRTFQRRRPNRGPGIRNRALIDSYEPRTYKSMPYRLLKPSVIKPDVRYPLIISLHGSGGVGDDNLSNLRFWNGVMARPAWRANASCTASAATSRSPARMERACTRRS